MKPSALLYRAAGSPAVASAIDATAWSQLTPRKRPPSPPGGACYLCGEPVAESGVPCADRFGETWTAHGTAAQPDADWLCLACAFSLSESATHPAAAKSFKMRSMSHLVIGDEWHVLGLADKRRMTAILLEPPPAPWLLCIQDAPLSAAHSIYRTPVNAPGAAHWQVTLGGSVIAGSPARLAAVLTPVEALYAAEHSKSAIRTGVYTPKWILAQGESAWAQLESSITSWVQLESSITSLRGQPIFELALFLAQKGTRRD